MDLATNPLKAPPEPGPRDRNWIARVGGFLWLAVCAWALHALHHEWSGFHFQDLDAALSRIGARHLALALAFTLLSYLCNAQLSVLAQRWLGHPPAKPWRDLSEGFIIAAFSMNAGGSVMGGGSIRMRFATASGTRAAEVAQATLFNLLAGWSGQVLLCGGLLLLTPPPLDWLPPTASRALGALLLLLGLATALGHRLKRRHAPGPTWPKPQLALLTLAVSALDWLFAGLAMWALFPETLPLSLGAFVAVVAIAQTISAFTHVPGGIGILELTVTKTLASSVATPVLAGALVTYRLIFYLLPFLLAILMLGFRELHQKQDVLRSGFALARRGWTALAPRLAALLALGGGFMLLLSANTPMEPARRSFLTNVLPLPFLEASHFLSSLAGALLIVLARGLQRRIEAAWWLTVAATAGGMIFSITKGLDWEEALSLGLLLACLLPFRRQFYRQAALWTHRFTLEWWLVLLALASVATWIGFFTARHLPYQKEMWWEFSYEGDAPRFLRALAGAACLFAIVALAQALRPRRPRTAPPGPSPETLAALVASSSQAGAALAWLSDKQILLAPDHRCGLMFADQGRSRVVMGDPLGDSTAADDLLWRFVEQAQDEGMRPVFYQISAEEMPRFVDMGFRLFKVGEEARVPLHTFTLEGTEARKLRQSRSRFQRGGFTFAVWDPPTVAAHLPTLRAISDAWLLAHRAGEKRFSMGCFEENYLQRFSCAVVLAPDGTPLAFSNIWTTADHRELSVDLMRHLPTAPSGIMESLFIEMILWGQAQGYAFFNLGMAPLSGLSTHPLAPLWHQWAARLFHKGGRLYNFQGLRAFKQKFRPEWEPRYLAVPSAWSLPASLLDITSLIGGGLRRAVGVGRR